MQNLNAVITTPLRVFPGSQDELPTERFCWTTDEYYRAAELGVFEGRHVELIKGDIIVKTDIDRHAKQYNGVEPPRFRWTSDQYYLLADAGLFGETRVELIEGEIIQMAPMGPIHATAIDLVAEFLRDVFGKGYFVRVQAPVNVDAASQPEPDIAVLIGSPRDYKCEHPKTPALAVEIADSSIQQDRLTKSKLYAKAGIEDYWIVNLVDSCIEVYRKPTGDTKGGHVYMDRSVFGEDESLSPLAKPKSKIMVKDILP